MLLTTPTTCLSKFTDSPNWQSDKLRGWHRKRKTVFTVNADHLSVNLRINNIHENFVFNAHPSDKHRLPQRQLHCVCEFFVTVSLNWFLFSLNVNITVITATKPHVHASGHNAVHTIKVSNLGTGIQQIGLPSCFQWQQQFQYAHKIN